MTVKQYYRVTEILYPFSGLRNIDPSVVKRAAERGTKVHEICDAMMCELGLFNIDENLEGYIKSFQHWLPKNFMDKPDRFYCDIYNLTGECDGIYKDDDGSLVLFDLKTPARESKTWALQGSAYSYLAKQAGLPVSRIEFVKLSKDGRKPVVYTYQENFDLFLKCLDVYKYFFEGTEENLLEQL